MELKRPIRDLEEIAQNGFSNEEKFQFLSSENQRLVQPLFWDLVIERTDRFTQEQRNNAPFTMMNCKGLHYIVKEGYPRYCFSSLYVATGDVTEYRFIKNFFIDQEHWEKALKNRSIRECVEKSREKLRLKLKSELYGTLLADAMDPLSRTSTSNAKYLIDKYYDPSTKNNKVPLKKRKEDDSKILKESKLLDTLRESTQRMN